MKIKDLNDFLENRFIENNARYRKVKSNDEIEEEPKYEMFIPLNKVLKLKITDEQKKYAIKFLKDKGIVVRGRLDTIDFECEDFVAMKISHGKTPQKMTAEENIEKFKEYYKTKDKKIRQEIIEGNMKLVWKTLRSMHWKYTININDLAQAGYIGLIEAIDNYDMTKGSFSTFASSYIKGYIQREIYNQEGFKTSEFDIYKVIKQVEFEEGETIRDNPNIATLVVDKLVNDGIKSNNFYDENIRKVMLLNKLSLEEILENNHEEVLYNLGYEAQDNDLNDIYDEEVIKTIRNEIAQLNDKKQKILKLYYGIENDEHTLNEVGEMFGITHQAVSFHMQNAFENLLKKNKVKALKNYLYKEI